MQHWINCDNCDKRECLSVCLSVSLCSHIPETILSNFIKFTVHSMCVDEGVDFCVCLCPRLEKKNTWAINTNLVHMQSMPGPQPDLSMHDRAIKGQRSRSRGYQMHCWRGSAGRYDCSSERSSISCESSSRHRIEVLRIRSRKRLDFFSQNISHNFRRTNLTCSLAYTCKFANFNSF